MLKKFFSVFATVIVFLYFLEKIKKIFGHGKNSTCKVDEKIYQVVSFDNLDESAKKALIKAKVALNRSWCGFSKFSVASCLFNQIGGYAVGVNLEFLSAIVCAEMSAIINAVSTGKNNFTGIVIISKNEKGSTQKPTPPCGRCRQMIIEFAQAFCRYNDILGGAQNPADFEIIYSTADFRIIHKTTIGKMLPESYDGENLD